MIEQKSVMIIAGEASGDLHGAKLVTAMRKESRALFFCGIGGQALKDAGVKILADASKLAVVGITEVFSKIPNFIRAMTSAKRLLKSLHPDLLILIDFPDFNLSVATTAKRLRIPVLYYIGPQVWAWRPGRAERIRRLVDHMAVILPFEEDFYRERKIPVTFVGHPLLDTNPPPIGKEHKKSFEDIPVIGLFPGSRDREIERHLPIMLDAVRILTRRIKNIKFIISLAPTAEKKYVEEIVEKHKETTDFELAAGCVERVFERCRLAVTVSGTVTLEAAIYGVPTVIIYKMSPVSYLLGRIMVKVKNIGLVNLIANEEIVPELLQSRASPKNIADTVLEMLNDAPGLEELRKRLLGIKGMLGEPGASERVAKIAMGMMYRRSVKSTRQRI